MIIRHLMYNSYLFSIHEYMITTEIKDISKNHLHTIFTSKTYSSKKLKNIEYYVYYQNDFFFFF